MATFKLYFKTKNLSANQKFLLGQKPIVSIDVEAETLQKAITILRIQTRFTFNKHTEIFVPLTSIQHL